MMHKRANGAKTLCQDVIIIYADHMEMLERHTTIIINKLDFQFSRGIIADSSMLQVLACSNLTVTARPYHF